MVTVDVRMAAPQQWLYQNLIRLVCLSIVYISIFALTGKRKLSWLISAVSGAIN